MILNDDQYKVYKEAIAWYKSPSSPQVFEIDGLAGTGKSVLIAEILKGLNLTADQYMPMAYTGQASIVMRTKGFNTAKSIHSSLYEVIEVMDRDDISYFFGQPKKKKSRCLTKQCKIKRHSKNRSSRNHQRTTKHINTMSNL